MCLLTSRKTGVRCNGLKGILVLLRRGDTLTRPQVDALCALLTRSTDSTTVRSLCAVLGQWTRQTAHAENDIVAVVGALPKRLAAVGTYEGGIARYVVETLNSLSQYADDGTMKCIGLSIEQLLEATNLQTVGNWKVMLRLIGRVASVEQGFLSQLVDMLDRQFTTDNLHSTNALAIAEAIYRFEGPKSLLLDRMRDSPWCPDRVQSAIAGFRGLN